MGPDGPKWGQEDFFPTNPDLADILGDTDFDFENFPQTELGSRGVLAVLLKGLERYVRARAVNFDR